MGVIKGDTRSLEYSSCDLRVAPKSKACTPGRLGVTKNMTWHVMKPKATLF